MTKIKRLKALCQKYLDKDADEKNLYAFQREFNFIGVKNAAELRSLRKEDKELDSLFAKVTVKYFPYYPHYTFTFPF